MNRLSSSNAAIVSTPGTPWISVAVVVAAGVVGALQVGKATIALEALRADLQLDLAAAGWVMSLFALIGALAGTPAGIAVNRFGDRKLLLTGLIAIACGSAAGALVHNLAALLVARVIEGAGFLLIVIAAPAVLQRIAAPKDRDLAFAIWSTFMPAGIALSLLIGPAFDGWRTLWQANAVISGLLAVLFVITVPRGSAASVDLPLRAIGGDVRAVFKAGGPLLLALIFVSFALQYFAVISFLPTLLAERMQVSATAAGVLSAIAIGSNILGNLAAGLLLKRGWSSWALIALSTAVMGITSIGIFVSALPAVLVFMLCVIFSGVGGILPATVLASAPRVAPSAALAPIVVGLVMQGNLIGQVLGPVAVGTAVDLAGWSAAAIPVLASAVIGIALALAFGRIKPAVSAAQSPSR